MKQLAIRIVTAFLKVLYSAAYRVGGTKHQIVCLSRQTDGTTTDFELLKQQIAHDHPDYRIIILAKTLSNPLSYAFHMLKQTVCIAQSQAVVLDSYCIVVGLLHDTIKAPVIQLWHAMGNMKKFGYATLDLPEGRSSEVARLMHMHEGYDCVVISSKSFIDDYIAGFNVSPDIVFECPLPKADLLTNASHCDAQRQAILDEYPQLRGKTNIVYCPTFRKPPSDRDLYALADLANAVDYRRYNLIYKQHPVSTLRFDDAHVFQDYDQRFDMLYVADVVITDYSTVMYEAGLMGVPIYLYLYDWDSYTERRGLNIDLKHDVPMPSAANGTEMIRLIDEGSYNRKALARFIYQNIAMPRSVTCSRRLVRQIFNLINTNQIA